MDTAESIQVRNLREYIKALETQLTSYQNQRTTLFKELNNLETINKNMRLEIDYLVSQLKQLDTIVDDKNAQTQRLKNQITSLKQQLSVLDKKIASKDQQIVQLSTFLKEKEAFNSICLKGVSSQQQNLKSSLRTQLQQQLQSKIQSLQSEIRQTKTISSQKDIVISNLQKSLEVKNSLIADKTKLLSQKQLENSNSVSNFRLEAQNERDRLNKRNVCLEEEISNLNLKLTKYNQNIFSLQVLLEQKQKLVQELETEKESIRQTLKLEKQLLKNRMNEDFMELQKNFEIQIHSLFADNSNFKLKIQQKDSVIKQLQQKLQEKKNIITQKESLVIKKQAQFNIEKFTLQALQKSEIQRLEKRITSYEIEIDTLRSQLNNQDQKIANYQRVISQQRINYETINQDLINKNQTLQTEKEIVKNQYKSLKNIHQIIRGSYETIKIDIQNLNNTLSDLQAVHEPIKTENFNLISQSSSLKSQNDALKHQSTRLNSQLQQIKAQNFNLISQSSSLKSQNDALKHQSIRINSQLQQIKTQNIIKKSALNQLQSQLSSQLQQLQLQNTAKRDIIIQLQTKLQSQLKRWTQKQEQLRQKHSKEIFKYELEIEKLKTDTIKDREEAVDLNNLVIQIRSKMTILNEEKNQENIELKKNLMQKEYVIQQSKTQIKNLIDKLESEKSTTSKEIQNQWKQKLQKEIYIRQMNEKLLRENFQAQINEGVELIARQKQQLQQNQNKIWSLEKQLKQKQEIIRRREVEIQTQINIIKTALQIQIREEIQKELQNREQLNNKLYESVLQNKQEEESQKEAIEKLKQSEDEWRQREENLKIDLENKWTQETNRILTEKTLKMDEQVNCLRQQLTEVRQQLNLKNEQLSKIKQSQTQLQQQIQNSSLTIKTLKVEISVLSLKIQEENKERTEKSQQLINKHFTENQQLQQKISALETQNKIKVQQLKTKLNQIEQKNFIIKQLQLQLEQINIQTKKQLKFEAVSGNIQQKVLEVEEKQFGNQTLVGSPIPVLQEETIFLDLRIENLEKELEDISEKNNFLESTVNLLRQENENLQKKYDQVQQKVKQLQSTQSYNIEQVNTLKIELQKTTNQTLQMFDKLQQKEIQLRERNNLLQQKQQYVAAYKNQYRLIENQLRHLEDQLQEKTLRLKESSHQLKQLSVQYGANGNDFSLREEQIKNKQNQIKDKQNLIKIKQNQIKNKEAYLKSIQNQLRNVQGQLNAQRSLKKSAQIQVECKLNELNQKQQLIRLKDQQIQQLKQKLNQQQQIIIHSFSDQNPSKQKAQTLSPNNQQTKDSKTYRSRIEQLEKQLQSNRKIIQEYQTHFCKQQSKLHSLKNENVIKQKKIEELKRQLASQKYNSQGLPYKLELTDNPKSDDLQLISDIKSQNSLISPFSQVKNNQKLQAAQKPNRVKVQLISDMKSQNSIKSPQSHPNKDQERNVPPLYNGLNQSSDGEQKPNSPESVSGLKKLLRKQVLKNLEQNTDEQVDRNKLNQTQIALTQRIKKGARIVKNTQKMAYEGKLNLTNIEGFSCGLNESGDSQKSPQFNHRSKINNNILTILDQDQQQGNPTFRTKKQQYKSQPEFKNQIEELASPNFKQFEKSKNQSQKIHKIGSQNSKQFYFQQLTGANSQLNHQSIEKNQSQKLLPFNLFTSKQETMKLQIDYAKISEEDKNRFQKNRAIKKNNTSNIVSLNNKSFSNNQRSITNNISRSPTFGNDFLNYFNKNLQHQKSQKLLIANNTQINTAAASRQSLTPNRSRIIQSLGANLQSLKQKQTK